MSKKVISLIQTKMATRRELLQLAKAHRSLIRVPLDSTIDRLRRAVRNANLLPGEAPEFHWFSFPNTNLLQLVLDKLPQRILLLLGNQPAIPFDYWNRKFFAQFKVPMKRKNDYTKAMVMLHAPEDEWIPLSKLGYIERFTEEQLKTTVYIYYNLLESALKEDTWSVIERLLNIDNPNKEDSVNQLFVNSIKLLEGDVARITKFLDYCIDRRLIRIDTTWEATRKAVELGYYSLVAALFDHFSESDKQHDSEVTKFVLRVYGTGNLKLIDTYWKLQRSGFNGYEIDELIAAWRKMSFTPDELYELIQFVGTRNQSIPQFVVNLIIAREPRYNSLLPRLLPMKNFDFEHAIETDNIDFITFAREHGAGTNRSDFYTAIGFSRFSLLPRLIEWYCHDHPKEQREQARRDRNRPIERSLGLNYDRTVYTRLPPESSPEQIERALRNAGRIFGEEPIKLTLRFPNQRCFHHVLAKINPSRLGIFKYQIVLPYEFWNNLFRKQFGFDMRTEETHRYDCADWLLNRWSKEHFFVEHGYFDQFTEKQIHTNERARSLGRCALYDHDWNGLERLFSSTISSKLLPIEKRTKQVNELMAIAVSELKQLSEVKRFVEYGATRLSEGLFVAISGCEPVVIDYLHDLMVSDRTKYRQFSATEKYQFMESLLVRGDLPLVRRYWSIYSYKVNAVDLTNRWMKGDLSDEVLMELMALIAEKQPKVYQRVLDRTNRIGLIGAIVAKLGKKADLSGSLLLAIDNNNQLQIDYLLSLGETISTVHLVRAVDNDNIELLAYLLTRYQQER